EQGLEEIRSEPWLTSTSNGVSHAVGDERHEMEDLLQRFCDDCGHPVPCVVEIEDAASNDAEKVDCGLLTVVEKTQVAGQLGALCEVGAKGKNRSAGAYHSLLKSRSVTIHEDAG